MQVRGAEAFRDRAILDQLRLSAEQRSQVLAIAGKIRPGDPDGESALAKIQSVLTPDQRKAWQEMLGKPFKGSKPGAFFPLPGQFGPPPD